MVAYKAGRLQPLLKSLNPQCRAALVYGPDAGLVADRATALANYFAGQAKGSTDIVRLDDRDLAEDGARLEVELRTVSMFADRKVVRLAAGTRLDIPSLKALLEAPVSYTHLTLPTILRV